MLPDCEDQWPAYFLPLGGAEGCLHLAPISLLPGHFVVSGWPDYPDFVNSSMPSLDKFEFSFNKLSHEIGKFTDKAYG